MLSVQTGRKRERRTTAEAAWLDAAALDLRPDKLGAHSLRWPSGEPGCFVFKTSAEDGFGLVIRAGWGQQRIALTTSAQPIGGLRWWFVCPRTGRRARKLYLPPGASEFASRQAHGLVYDSTRDNDDLDRSWRRVYRARARLGPGEPTEPPVRPKGMRKARFEALQQQFHRLHCDHLIKLDEMMEQALARETAALEKLAQRVAARARQPNAPVHKS